MKNKYSPDLCKLVIENVVQHENTIKVIDEIEQNLMSVMDDEIKSLVEDEAVNYGIDLSENEKLTNFSFSENSYHIFTNDKWVIDDDAISFFSIASDEDEGHNWLTHMCGEMSSSNYLALWIEIERKKCGFTGPTGIKNFKQALSEQFEKYPELKDAGFHIHSSGEYIYHPFTFSLQDIADNYPDNLADAITPATEAVESLFKMMDPIEKIVDYFYQLAKEK